MDTPHLKKKGGTAQRSCPEKEKLVILHSHNSRKRRNPALRGFRVARKEESNREVNEQPSEIR